MGELQGHMAIDHQHLGHDRGVIAGMLALHAEAGIADHQTDVERVGRVKHLPRRRRFGKIDLANMRPNTMVSRELRGQLLEALYASRYQDEIQLPFGEKLREGFADAGRCASDEGDRAVSVEKIGHMHFSHWSGRIDEREPRAQRRRRSRYARGRRVPAPGVKTAQRRSGSLTRARFAPARARRAKRSRVVGPCQQYTVRERAVTARGPTSNGCGGPRRRVGAGGEQREAVGGEAAAREDEATAGEREATVLRGARDYFGDELSEVVIGLVDHLLAQGSVARTEHVVDPLELR